MRARASALPATLVVLVLFPFVVAVGSAGSTDRQREEPKEASLTAYLALPPGFDLERPLYVKVRAPGQAPNDPVTLLDAAGLNVATVTKAKNEDCSDVRLRVIASTSSASSTDWCLEIRGLNAGTEATGTIPGDATKLMVTVGVRHNWWGLPLAVAVLGLVAAFTVLIVPNRLRAFVKEVLLARALDRNDNAGVERITDLREWVAQQLRKGKTASDLLPIVVGVVEREPGQAVEARTQLTQALASATELPSTHQLRIAAQDEAARTDNRASDFLTEDGGLREKHPASLMVPMVQRMNEHATSLRGEQERINQLKSHCRMQADDAMKKAKSAFDQVRAEDQLSALEQALNNLMNTVDTAFGRPDCVEREPGPRGARPREALAPSTTLAIAPGGLRRALALAGVATFLVVATAITFAFVSIFYANYAPTQTFGTQTDYFTLFTAALGSTAAASVLATLMYWNVNEKADE
jgi:hypothetical protein